MGSLIGIVVVLVVGGVIAVVAGQLDKKRTAAIEAQAGLLKMTFSPAEPTLLGQGFGTLPLFNQGRAREAKNVLSGSVDAFPGHVFDYRFVTGYGRSRQVHSQTVVAVQLPRPMPTGFELRPEGFFHKIGSALGYQDIDFQTHPVFSKSYLLRGPDEAAIRRFFDASVLGFLERQPGWSVEAAGEWLAIFKARRVVKPEELRQRVTDASAIARTFAKG